MSCEPGREGFGFEFVAPVDAGFLAHRFCSFVRLAHWGRITCATAGEPRLAASLFTRALDAAITQRCCVG